jgi:signal transduction histidine kinase
MEEMRQREKDLLDIMGHELRTPLTIARNSMDLMEMYKKNQKKKEKQCKWNSDMQKQFESYKSSCYEGKWALLKHCFLQLS